METIILIKTQMDQCGPINTIYKEAHQAKGLLWCLLEPIKVQQTYAEISIIYRNTT